MRALIVDDEAPARLALRRLLGSFPQIEIAGEAASGPEAIEQVEALTPDVLFLDIEMPGLNGFDVLAELKSALPVVFVTAYDQYAVKAFEANAVDYLLKPVQRPALERALKRAFERGKDRTAQPTLTPELIGELRQSLFPGAPAKLAARRGRKVILIPRRDILYAQAEDRLVFLCTATDRFLTDRTLNELEALLPATEFFRLSRAVLVSLEAIHEMYPWMTSGAWQVRLTNGTELDVSRERVRAFRQTVGL
jgi:two-component system LytT family response regulator